jgi:ubiquinone/menaquinone biosynthesis C-methylase UbiE
LTSSDIIPDFFCTVCSGKYSLNNGYPDFLGDKDIIHKSRWEKTIRDLYAKFYTVSTNFMFFFLGGAKNARDEVLSLLELRDNAIVLETGMGPGDNFPMMTAMAKNIKIFAIDIQKQMLIHSMRNIKKWKTDAELFRADAEELPFRDKMFDVVFHLGAFNLFSNKKKALDEMIRVAKPGARIVIADESEKGNRIFNVITGNKIEFVLPVDLVPQEMQDLIVRTIWKGYGYVIAFTKPLA